MEGFRGVGKGLGRALILSLSFVILINACGGGFESNEENQAFLDNEHGPGQVIKLSFEGGVTRVRFNQVSENNAFSLISYSASKSQQDLFTFELVASLGNLLGKNLSPLLYNPEENLDPQQDFHQRLRQEEKLLAQVWLPPLPATPHKALQTEDCATANAIGLKMLTSLQNLDQYQWTCGIPRYSSNLVDYLVDERVTENFSNIEIQEIAQNFEKLLFGLRKIIGEESDVNGDGRFCVYFSPAVNLLGKNVNALVTGFFFAGDLSDTSLVTSSNERECLYISIPDEGGQYGLPIEKDFWKSNLVLTVLPHEYQHMVNFNQKVLLRGGNPAAPWENEGLSHLIEDYDPDLGLGNQETASLNGQEDALKYGEGSLPNWEPQQNPIENKINLMSEFPQASKENPSRVAIYLKDPTFYAFSRGAGLGQRGGSYLFFRYLCEQADKGRYSEAQSCTELLGRLIKSDLNGIQNIKTAAGVPFDSLLSDFFAALQLSDTGLTEDPRYQFEGICLQCQQQDNRGTQLAGPQSVGLNQGLSRSLGSSSALYQILSGSDLINMGLKFELHAPEEGEPGALLIRLQ